MKTTALKCKKGLSDMKAMAATDTEPLLPTVSKCSTQCH